MLTSEDREALDRLVNRLDYPMPIVTAEADGERAGRLVGFATQCGIDRPRFLLCLSRRNHTFRVASRSGTLVAHVVGPEHQELASLFGEQTGDVVDRFARCRWRTGPGGPVLAACQHGFAGRVQERLGVGDQVAFLVEPMAAAAGRIGGQLWFQDARRLRPGHPP
jgi:flavin reductase (DIM6/NTAB) family NADH-FMN oxidoreductase RutF